MRPIKKTLFTLNIGNYAPEITALTYPLLRGYAEKIGADFYIINERKFPDFPMDYEKIQIWELAKAQQNDWNLYIDSDALVHPDFFDLTNHVHKSYVLHNGADMASVRWKYDQYFLRDGRHIGSCNWFAMASDWCLDLWHPLDDIPLAEAIKNIRPTTKELASAGSCREPKHLITDYLLSRNIARYGLKFLTTNDLLKKIDPESDYLWHIYTVSRAEKLRQMKDVMVSWNLLNPAPIVLSNAMKIEGFMQPEELAWLARRAHEHKQIIEIGSYLGRSTRVLADNSPGIVMAIDDWKGCRDLPPNGHRDYFAEFEKNMVGLKNLQSQKMDYSQLSGAKLNVCPDMVFVDGDHSYDSVKRDLLWAKSVMAPDGLLCGHDYDRPEVRRAIRDVIPEYQILSGIGLLWWADSKG